MIQTTRNTCKSVYFVALYRYIFFSSHLHRALRLHCITKVKQLSHRNKFPSLFALMCAIPLSAQFYD